jgi:hypothetical protein
MYTIYALIDPRDRSVHYVGMTDHVYKRFQQHLNTQEKNDPKNAWLKSMRDIDVMILMESLETTSDLEEARQREAYWIRHYTQLKMPLTNQHIPALSQKKNEPRQKRRLRR